jgi:hypothetical protein
MEFTTAADYTGDRAWDALDLAEFEEPATVRLHWTDAPYIWHVNDPGRGTTGQHLSRVRAEVEDPC